MTDPGCVEGIVQAGNIVLSEALPELEGKRVRVTLEVLGDVMSPAAPTTDVSGQLPPMARLIGRTIVETTPDGTAVLRFDGSTRFSNRFGTIQGGMLAAMLDSSLAIAVMATLAPGQSAVTVEMSTRFFRAAQPGTLEARASVLQGGKTLVHAQSDLYDATGTRVAHATGSLRIVGDAA
jgi:uncharacterized protein (TIGR00369 family)